MAGVCFIQLFAVWLWLSHTKVLSSHIHFSVIISKAYSTAQADIMFFTLLRCTLACIYVVNETDGTLQFLFSGWPMVDAAGFQEVCFYHSNTTYPVGVCHFVAWLQNTHYVLVLSSYRFHRIYMLITEIFILWWTFVNLCLWFTNKSAWRCLDIMLKYKKQKLIINLPMTEDTLGLLPYAVNGRR
jgi:hypothetical protein